MAVKDSLRLSCLGLRRTMTALVRLPICRTACRRPARCARVYAVACFKPLFA
jgi:hypothetical protein